MVDLYRHVLRPLLFRLSADRAHALAHLALRWPAPWRLLAGSLTADDPRLATTIAGLPLANPIGLAAGFDKNAQLLPALAHLGFGYIVAGSVMLQPRPGNPLPRTIRYPAQRSLADSSGLPSQGLAAAIHRLRRRRGGVPVMVSVGGFSGEELAEALLAVDLYADAVEINLACPNVDHQGDCVDDLRTLIDAVGPGRTKPVCIKLPLRAQDDEGRLRELIALSCEADFEMLKINGGRRIDEPRFPSGRGTLNGRLTFPDALRNVERAAELAAGRMAIKANGGVFTGEQAFRMLAAGASTVEVYTAFVYQGWAVARNINRQLLTIPTRSTRR